MSRRALAALVTLAALAASCSQKASPPGGAVTDSTIGETAPPTGSKSQVAFVAVSPDSKRVALALGPDADSLVFTATRSALSRWLVRRLRGREAVASIDASISSLDTAGTVDLHHDGTRDAFFVTSDGGTGLTNRELNVYCPKAGKVVTLTLTFMHDDTRPVAEIVRSDELEQPAFAPEASFLEGVKRDYGYVSPAELAARTADPRYAFYFWRSDNAGLADGAAMRVRHFKGRHPGGGTIGDTLSVGGITYTAYLRSGVVAYDPAQDEHWVVFHPDDPYAWPTHLATAGGVLVIGTRGEGLALVRLSDLRLKRMKVLGNDDVESLAIADSTIVVNGEARLAMPVF